jgi:hypothetical protein
VRAGSKEGSQWGLCVGVIHEADSTPNAQRPTSNVQQKKGAQFDLEDRLLEFSARIIRLVDAALALSVGRWALDVGRLLHGLSCIGRFLFPLAI